MNEKNINKQKLYNAILSSSSEKINSKNIDDAVKGDFSGIMSQMSENDRKKLNAALTDKNKAKEILSSDAAKEVLKNLLNGGKNNG